MVIRLDRLILWSTAFFLVLLSSCSGVKTITESPGREKSYCNHQTTYTYTKEDLPQHLYRVKMERDLSQYFSFRALNVANAIGLLEPITQYDLLKNSSSDQTTPETRIRLLEWAFSISQRINTASLEISSAASELDCEEERASQLANYLKGQESVRENRLIIGSIIVGAIGSVTADLLSVGKSTGNSGTYVAVGASLLEALLGVMMLRNKCQVYYFHSRNTLGEIWNLPEISKTLPPSIWYYLTYKEPKKNEKSLAELLAQQWLSYGQVEKTKNKKGQELNNLYFGTGGKYSSEQLKNRADMYDQIEAYITLMKQDLKQLSLEFEKFCGHQ